MPATRITRFCQDAHCVPALKGDSKQEAISELIETFVDSGTLSEKDAQQLYAEIIGREEEASTGIGKGIAIPHPEKGASGVVSETLIAVGLHAEGIDFDATDGAPVHIVFVIASPDPDEYLQVAARIARVARDDVEMRALRAQKTSNDIRTFLEESLDGTASTN